MMKIIHAISSSMRYLIETARARLTRLKVYCQLRRYGGGDAKGDDL